MSTIPSVRSDHRERERTHMARQLRRARQDWEHFVRALSHDMSANFMLLDSSFLRLKESLDTETVERLSGNLAHMDACLDQSKRFLNDLIHLAKTGSVEMEPERVELAAIVDEVLFEQDELARGRGVRFDVRRPLPAVWYNRQRLKQIVTNLIRNAIKHGCDPKSPCIEIRATKDREATSQNDIYPTVELRVRDNGPGIDPRFAEEVFLPGKRLSQDEDGTGMGLAIVKRIAEYYGGSAWIDYDQPEGTTVAVLLPGGFSVPAAEPWMTPRLENRGAAAAGVAPPHLPRRRRAAPPSRH